MKIQRFALALCASLLLFASAHGQKTFTAKVVGVHDGDTITVLDSRNQQFKIRLAGIDAPELRQEFGQKSKYNLSGFIFGKNVLISFTKTDKYGRIVGKVSLNGVDVNLKQIEDGFAWHYKEYESEQSENDRKIYAEAEKRARVKEFGLWIQPALAPWEWRAKKSEGGNESPTPPSAAEARASQESEAPAYSGNPGTTTTNGSGKTVTVRPYTRKDGTVVRGHTRSKPN